MTPQSHPIPDGHAHSRQFPRTRAAVWLLCVVGCLAIGVYPILYFVTNGRMPFLQLKSAGVLNDGGWRLGFYAHIASGGIAMLVGWTQFMSSWRKRYPGLHRFAGKVYVLMACLSGVAAVWIAPSSTTGWVAGLGFGTLGVVWVCVTVSAYRSARRRNWRTHERLMIYSYSACFAAVTLRVWLPLFLGVFHLDYSLAYPVVAWLCWVPNLIVAHRIASRV